MTITEYVETQKKYDTLEGYICQHCHLGFLIGSQMKGKRNKFFCPYCGQKTPFDGKVDTWLEAEEYRLEYSNEGQDNLWDILEKALIKKR